MSDQKITILDGGMGRELERIGAPFRQPEWSALALIESPDRVAQAHKNFINAGAKIITTNAYAVVPFHIGAERFDNEGYELAQRAAKIARDCAGDTVRVAGCIPPPFGSYRPDAFDNDKMAEIISPLVNAQDNYIDFWLIETIPSVNEAQAIISLVKSLSQKPIWLSFTLETREDKTKEISQLRSGENVNAITPILEQIETVLFNCSAVEEMEDAIKIVRTLNADIPIGVYANAFAEKKRTHAANEGLTKLRDNFDANAYCDLAQKWVDANATILGGCCGIGPDYIQALSDRFK